MPLVVFFRSQGPDVSAAAILSLMGYLTLVVSGYDEDPRELWQVPEVRAYCTELHRLLPQIYYYLSLENNMIPFFYAATRATCTAEDPLAWATAEDVAAFLEETFYRMNEYLANFDINYHASDRYLHHCNAIAKMFSASLGAYLH